VTLAELERAPDDAITVTRYIPQRSRPMMPVPTELHLRGLRVEAALYELEKYLDQAVVAGHPRVRIVHGKGTGAVRQAVHERLRESRLVKSFRLGESGEGDTGVTVVELGEG
jgi:DNA mismatch repair protein MutS2